MAVDTRSHVEGVPRLDHHHPTTASDAGTVVLDIGSGVGAAVVRAPHELQDREIEIRRTGHPWRGRHVAVRPRTGPYGRQFAAIFGGLEPGSYELRVLHGRADEPVLMLEVRDATVTQADWPAR